MRVPEKMKRTTINFVTEDGSVNCVRTVTDTETGDAVSRVVATFGAEVDCVAPHVAAALNPREIRELEQWLKDRANLETEPPEKAVLEVLPQMLDEAIAALDEVDELDAGVYQALQEKVSAFSAALEEFSGVSEDSTTNVRKMKGSEVMKEKLEIIKKNL